MRMRVSAGSAFSRALTQRAHAARDLERLLVAGHFVGVEQARQNLVQRVVRRPDLAVLRAVRGAAFEHDELVGRIGADEARAPVPVVGANRAGPQIRVVALTARPNGHRGRIGHRRSAWLCGPARLLRQVVQRVHQVVHLLEEVLLQRRVVPGARIRLRDGRQIVAARVPSQPRRLAIPSAEWFGAFRLRLTERFSEVVEEAVRIRGRETAKELVAVLDERRVAALRVAIEHDLVQRERFDQAVRRRRRADRRLDDDRRLRLEAGCRAHGQARCTCRASAPTELSVGDGQITRTSPAVPPA